MLISPYPLLKITQDIDHGILPIAQTRKAWPTAAVAGTREAFVERGGRSGAAFVFRPLTRPEIDTLILYLLPAWRRRVEISMEQCAILYAQGCGTVFCNGCTPRMFDEWGKLEPNLFLMHVTAACLSHQ